jgi:hypothetical protein
VTRPNAAAIFTALAQLLDRDPAQAKLDRVSASAIRAARAMQESTGRDPQIHRAMWLTQPRPGRRRRVRKPPCCDHRGRYGHRGEGARWRRCPQAEP